MKRIAIFCDGTWNRPDAQNPTNVFKLHKATRLTGMDGVSQLPKYIPGVGTGFGMTGLRARFDRIQGGLFGTGVTRNIMIAYRFLTEFYAPGDEIYIFGFSRGAFTARSLAGMIRASGLPPHDRVHRAGEALQRYRDRHHETKPDAPESWAFRRDFSPGIVTSEAERDWRNRQQPGSNPHLLSITYLGVWDTVGAMGVPGHYRLLARAFNTRHEFHDAQLSRSVLAARHAVAIDERRRTFMPTLWENLADLNFDDPERARNYRQFWFPGDHGSVGGGGDIAGLSNISLRWIAEGAAAQGLDFDWIELNKLKQQEEYTAPLHNQSAPASLTARLLRRSAVDRAGPDAVWDVSTPARARWHHTPLPPDWPGPYRPVPLRKVASGIEPPERR